MRAGMAVAVRGTSVAALSLKRYSYVNDGGNCWHAVSMPRSIIIHQREMTVTIDVLMLLRYVDT
jgi:hypothetical protein